MNQQHLTTLVNSFVLPSKRSRLLEFLASKRRYPDFLDNLLHDPRYFDPKVIVELSGNERTAERVLARLKGLGAKGDAYLVGYCGEFEDGHIGTLEALLAVCVGSMQDALVYSWQANVAYYEGHEGFAYLLHSAPN